MLNIELKFRAFNKSSKKLYRSGALSFSTERHSFMMYSDKDMDGVKDYNDKCLESLCTDC